jgi:putative ABC transport system permease protein
MYLLEIIRLSWHTLLANKLRAILTMLGISIGVGAVIALMAVGNGVQNYITQQFSSAGTNLVIVIPGQITSSSSAFGPQAALTMGDYTAIVDNTPFLQSTSAAFSGPANLTFASNDTQISVSGVMPEYTTVRNWGTRLGRFFDDSDYSGRARVVVLGQTTAKNLFQGDDPLDKTIKINNVPFRVIGVMAPKGSSFLGDQDATAFIPLSTAQDRLFQTTSQTATGQKRVSTIVLKVLDDGSRPIVEASVKDLLRERHRIPTDEEDDFSVVSQAELISAFSSITNVLTIFLGAIAAISLLVGGIGIMNIMLVSVTERTREIGLRKAIGATSSAILSQFLVEAVFLSVIGGTIGIVIGVGGANLIALAVADFRPEVQLSAVALAVGFSVAVGLFFGIYPARRASRLNPIDALRYE